MVSADRAAAAAPRCTCGFPGRVPEVHVAFFFLSPRRGDRNSSFLSVASTTEADTVMPFSPVCAH